MRTITIILCFFLTTVIVMGQPKQQTELEGQPNIAAISDIHVNRSGWENKINKAFAVLTNQTPKLDAIFIVGDITHNGTESEFELVKKVVSEKISSDIPVYYCLGNHDWWTKSIDAAKVFEQTFGQPTNQYIKIKDYPFILISMENKNQATAYGSKTRLFLTETLGKASQEFPNKPIFVFMHVPNESTVYGSYAIGGNDSWGTPNVSDILEQYPQVVAISGHSHYLLDDERSIHQDKFTSINDGSITYSETEEGLFGGVRPADSEKTLQGCFLSINSNNDVTVKRWDFYNDKEIKSPWKILAPHDGSNFLYKGRTGKPNPYFESNDKVMTAFKNAKTCIVTFPAAKAHDNVTYYKVELLDGDKNLIRTDKLLSDYYFLSPKTTYSHTINNLYSDQSYIVRVIAIDSFGNESEPILSDVFTGEEEPVPSTKLIENGDFEGLATLHQPRPGSQEIDWSNDNPSALLVSANSDYTPGDKKWRLKKSNSSAIKTDFYPAEEANGGTQSLKLQVDKGYSTSNGTHPWYNNSVYQSISVDKTQKYEVKLWAKGNGKLFVQFYTNYSGNTARAIAGQPNKTFKGTEQWTQYTFLLDIPSKAEDNKIITDEAAYTERTILSLALQTTNEETEKETKYVWVDNVEVYSLGGTGIDFETEETPISIYVNNKTIYFNIDQTYTVTVFDLTGQVIISKEIAPGDSLPMQEQGCFVIKLNNKKGNTKAKTLVIK